MPKVPHNAVIALAFASLLGGCASTTDLKTPTETFATLATANQELLQAYDKSADDYRLETNIHDAAGSAANGNSAVDITNSDCQKNSQRCQIVLKDPPHALLEPAPVGSAGLDVMSGIVTYAENLRDLAGYDASGAGETALNTTKKSLLQALSDIDGINNTSLQNEIKPYTSVAVKAISAIIYIDKMNALRETTRAVNDLFPALHKVYALSIDDARSHLRRKLQSAYDKAQSKWIEYVNGTGTPAAGSHKKRPQATPKPAETPEQLLKSYQTAAKAYDTFLVNDPERAFEALENAHGALTAEMQKDKPDFANAIVIMKNAAKQLQKTQAAVKALGASSQPASN